MPADEAARLAALRKYQILDTDAEQAFDDLAMLASQVCGTPIALITLVDEKRQWFKARVGVDVRETDRSVSICAHAIQQHDLFIVPDTRIDPRFSANPMVTGEYDVRFYAGAPLIDREGHALGTICVVDHQPRTLTPDQARALEALRRQAMAQLELRRHLVELSTAIDGLEKLGGLMPFCAACELNMVIPAEPASIGKVSAGVQQLLQRKGWPDDEIMKVELGLEEALANAIRHGCKNDPTKHVQCAVTFDVNGELVIVVRDPGPGFDPKAVPNPLEGDNLFKTSGRGVFLINELMDEVAYADRGREVQMRKSVKKERSGDREIG